MYCRLAKPGIVYANVLTTLAGYLFASRWHVYPASFLAVLAGTALIIGGAAVFNNVLDRGIDGRMKRTQKRPLVTGEISVRHALAYAVILSVIGFGLLILWTNWRVVAIGLVGAVDYVLLYGWAKRHTPLSTLVGSLSGSASIVAGYCAYTHRLDSGGWILFAILTLWQMPHFYSLALYRRSDYAAAKLPVMPVIRSSQVAQARIFAYIVALLLACVLLTTGSLGGISSLVVMVGLCVGWLVVGLKSVRRPDVAAWGKRMFLFSLIVNIGLSLAIALGSVAP